VSTGLRFKELMSVETIKLELYRAAFGVRKSPISLLDPRVAILWYLTFAIIPWFLWDRAVLGLMVAFTASVALLARVSPLLLGLFVLGLITEGGAIVAISLIFGGGIETLQALITLQLKLSIISLASLAMFVSMDPEKLADGLLALGAPPIVGFAVSYGYRMLPTMLDEFHGVVNAYRSRVRRPEESGFLGWRQATHWAKLILRSFYPVMLNSAKRTRTTVEALESRGFTFTAASPDAKRLRIAHLAVGVPDAVFIAITLTVFAFAYLITNPPPWS
jgi:energy-coupling factor transport system permease protein